MGVAGFGYFCEGRVLGSPKQEAGALTTCRVGRSGAEAGAMSHLELEPERRKVLCKQPLKALQENFSVLKRMN